MTMILPFMHKRKGNIFTKQRILIVYASIPLDFLKNLETITNVTINDIF